MIHRRRGRDRGAVLPLVAILLPVLVLMTAFAVDLGRQRASRRDMQAIADVVALDLSRLADGRAIADIGLAATTELHASATRNDVAPGILRVEWGHWDGTSFETHGTLDPTHGWIENVPDSAIPADRRTNATRVTATETTEYVFQPGSGSATRHAIAQHGVDDLAGFQVGSFTLAAGDEGVLNALVSALVGAPVSLHLAGYEGLAEAHVAVEDLLGFIDVPDVGVPLSALDPEEALDATISLQHLLEATVQVIGDDVARATLEGIVDLGIPDVGVRLGDLLSAGSGAADAALDASVDVLSLLTAAATIANCHGGAQPAECNAVAIPGVGIDLFGLTSLDAEARIVQGPLQHHGRVGSGVDTGQVQVSASGAVGTTNLPCPAGLELLCLGGVVPASIELDLDATVVGGPNTIDDIECGTDDALTVRTETQLLQLDTDVRVVLGVSLPVPTQGTVPVLEIAVDVGASVDEHDRAALLDFRVPPDVYGETVRAAAGPGLGLAGVSVDTDITTTTLLPGVDDLLAPILSLVTHGLVEQVLVDTVAAPLLAAVDAALLDPLLETLGLRAVGSDIVPLDIACAATDVLLVQ